MVSLYCYDSLLFVEQSINVANQDNLSAHLIFISISPKIKCNNTSHHWALVPWQWIIGTLMMMSANGKKFPCYCPFVRRIQQSPLNSPHKGQWCRALMFSLICAWTNGWANNQDAGDLRRHHAHYDVTAMIKYWVTGTMRLYLIDKLRHIQ